MTRAKKQTKGSPSNVNRSLDADFRTFGTDEEASVSQPSAKNATLRHTRNNPRPSTEQFMQGTNAEASVTKPSATDNTYIPVVASVPTENETEPHAAASTTAEYASVTPKDDATEQHEASVTEGSKPTREHEASVTEGSEPTREHEASVTEGSKPTREHEASVTEGSEPTRELSILSSIPLRIQECSERRWWTVPPDDEIHALVTEDKIRALAMKDEKKCTLLKVGDILKFTTYHGYTHELRMHDFERNQIITGTESNDFVSIEELRQGRDLSVARNEKHTKGGWYPIPDPLLMKVKRCPTLSAYYFHVTKYRTYLARYTQVAALWNECDSHQRIGFLSSDPLCKEWNPNQSAPDPLTMANPPAIMPDDQDNKYRFLWELPGTETTFTSKYFSPDQRFAEKSKVGTFECPYCNARVLTLPFCECTQYRICPKEKEVLRKHCEEQKHPIFWFALRDEPFTPPMALQAPSDAPTLTIKQYLQRLLQSSVKAMGLNFAVDSEVELLSDINLVLGYARGLHELGSRL